MADPPSPHVRRVLLRPHTACPRCRKRHVVDVKGVMRVQPPGTFSLAGAQTKFPARESWRYECTNCGATGPAAPPSGVYSVSALGSMPRHGCGHTIVTTHYPRGRGHVADSCPGCCPACQRIKDEDR